MIEAGQLWRSVRRGDFVIILKYLEVHEYPGRYAVVGYINQYGLQVIYENDFKGWYELCDGTERHYEY